jgi:hypothetical protein
MLLSRNACAVLLMVSALIAGPAQAGWQDMPDGIPLQPVGDDLQMNGTPMQIRAFVTPMPLGTVLREVQASWERASNHVAVKRAVNSPWTILNQTVGDQHRSLQVKQAGGMVQGFVAVSSPKLNRPTKLAVRLPSEMAAVSVIDSMDQGRASQQVIAVSRRSVDASASALEEALAADGWVRHAFKKMGKSVMFAANKGKQQFQVTLSGQQSGSIAMMNTIKD